MTYRVGTRGSKLAMAQTEGVIRRLEASWPDAAFEIVVIRTTGDSVTDRPLAAIGGSAVFTHEIERALAAGEIDLAVHSMKDLPAVCAEGLVLAKAWPRADSRDCLIVREGVAHGLADLPVGAVVGTGSPRRQIQIHRLRPDLVCTDIRGNVETRLRKLCAPAADEPRLDAIVLARAGLQRLGFDTENDHAMRSLDPDEMLPAPNQGQLAIEVRAADAVLRARLDELGDDEAESVARAERDFLRELGTDCHQPVAAHAAQAADGTIELRVLFARAVNTPIAEATVRAATPEAAAFAAAVAVRRQIAGEVVLVGAGPGDPDLITVKGLRAIREADAIVYDRLASDQLLENARPGCDLVYVGKASGDHTLPQDEINALLARKALAFDRVVRLKGGDSFVFGRGGEEMAYLLERGVSCRTIPGVTSAIAAAESAGIPVTHRGVARGFEVVTAHARQGETLPIDFTAMRDPQRTRVFLMGLARVADIAAGLVAAGRDPGTPAAVIASGTLPAERCVTGTLATITARVRRANLVSPAVLVVGETVRLRRQLGFPLDGRRLLVPRIGDARGRAVELLERLGAEVTAPEVGRIVARDEARTAFLEGDFTWLALTSRNGLLAFDSAMVNEARIRGMRVAALGKGTAEACRAKGFEVDFVSPVATGAGMCAAFASVLDSHDRVLHPTAEGVPDALAELAARCTFVTAAAYCNEAVACAGRITLDDYDAAVFTCASSAERLLRQASGTTRFVAMGPMTRRALESCGATPIVTAVEPGLEGLAQAVVEALSR